MLQPDLQRLSHIRGYYIEIEKTITRYGKFFEVLTATPIISDPYRFASFRWAN